MTTNKTNQLNSLFEDWCQEPEINNIDFRKDGILDEQRWNSCKLRILFLLKDANGSLSSDLRDDWKKRPWKMLSYWTYGLTNVTQRNRPSFEEVEKQYQEDLFHGTAILNLKKTVGTSRADMAEIERWADRHRPIIMEEIRIISPDVVICGGTFDIAKKTLLGGHTSLRDLVQDRSFQVDDHSLWVNSWHPSYPRKSYRAKYDRVMAVIPNESIQLCRPAP